MAQGHAHHSAKAAVKHSKKRPHAKVNACIPCQAKRFAALDDCTQKAIQAAPPSMCEAANQNIPIIMAECRKQGITDTNQIAYVLATAEHESRLGKTMTEEASGADYTKIIGNTSPDDAARYKGHGFVQLTGKANYETWSKKTGEDLVKHPEKANDPQIAAEILVKGMKEGDFRPRNKLDTYIHDKHVDFTNAREIINTDKTHPLDKNHPKTSPKIGPHVGDIAKKYAQALEGCSSKPPASAGEQGTGELASAPLQSVPPSSLAEVTPDPGSEFERNRLATQFYQANNKSPEDIMSHRDGIDMSKPVSVKMLQPGGTIARWEFPDRGLKTGIGDTYASYPGENPEKMGIVMSRPSQTVSNVSMKPENMWVEEVSPAQSAQPIQRVQVTYTVTKPMQVLESTAADLPTPAGAPTVGGKGGARQLWLPDTSGLVKQ